MTIKEMVKDYLEKEGYDGLCTIDCGCNVDDLMPCDNYLPDCVAGYKVPCLGGEDCPADGDCPWHIAETKLKDTLIPSASSSSSTGQAVDSNIADKG